MIADRPKKNTYSVDARQVLSGNVVTETIIESTFSVFKQTPPEDPTPQQTLAVAESSGAFDFWDHPDEDIYSLEDGEAV